MSILYADVAYRRCHVSIRQTGFPRTPSRPMSPYGGGFGRFGGRMAVVTLFISYWDHFMRNFNLVCNSVHVFPRIAIKFCMCDFTPSTLEPVFSQFFHEISVSSEIVFDISAEAVLATQGLPNRSEIDHKMASTLVPKWCQKLYNIPRKRG